MRYYGMISVELWADNYTQACYMLDELCNHISLIDTDDCPDIPEGVVKPERCEPILIEGV